MNHQNTTNATIFQDRNLLALPDARPINSWQRLTAGDDKAESFEGFLRATLILSLVGALLLSALSVRPAQGDVNPMQMSAPLVHLPQMIERAPAAAVQAVAGQF